MRIELTPEFSSRVFEKVGKLSRTDLDLSSEESQVAFAKGFVEYLEKEASMPPEMAVGFIHYICKQGEAYLQKKAGIIDGIGNLANSAMSASGKGLGYAVDKLAPASFSNGAAQGFAGAKVDDWKKEFQNTGVGKWMQSSGLEDAAEKGWNWIKDPNHLKQVAGTLIPALGGYLLPKLWGGGTVEQLAGATAGGLLGNYAANHSSDITNEAENAMDALRKSNVGKIFGGGTPA